MNFLAFFPMLSQISPSELSSVEDLALPPPRTFPGVLLVEHRVDLGRVGAGLTRAGDGLVLELQDDRPQLDHFERAVLPVVLPADAQIAALDRVLVILLFLDVQRAVMSAIVMRALSAPSGRTSTASC